MKRFLVTVYFLSQAVSVLAKQTDELVQEISAHIVKVQVTLNNGGFGLGSGVVVDKDQIVTNCHVVANALSISVNTGVANYAASGLKSDWHHDLCILKVEGLDLQKANIGSSNNLKYEQPVYSIGFGNFSQRPNGTLGFVKGLYPMDDSVVIRASNTFRLGDSGGGVFDEEGNLVGIITVKSPGRNAFYYNMSVEWVKSLLLQPEKSIVTPSELPFWAEADETKWPYFMRIVQPLKTEDWKALSKIATTWTEKEPNNTEAWYYQGIAEYSLNRDDTAAALFNQVVSKNSSNSSAIYYLGLIAEKNGKHLDALNFIEILNHLDENTASELKVAMGITLSKDAIPVK